MRPSRYATRSMGWMGAPLITGGAAPTVVSYNPTWCGQEVCGPPPGTTTAARPAQRLVPLHFAASTPPPAATPAPAPAKVIPLHFYQPPATVTLAPPVVTASPPPVGGGDFAPPPAPSSGGGGGGGAASCSCSWWPAILFAAAGFGAAYVAQNKPKKRKAA